MPGPGWIVEKIARVLSNRLAFRRRQGYVGQVGVWRSAFGANRLRCWFTLYWLLIDTLGPGRRDYSRNGAGSEHR
jgi:hypothetical protein